jgi:hypothetical protein
VGKSSPKTLISASRKFAAAWLFEAMKVVHAVVLHQATTNPKSLPYRLPPASAAQLPLSDQDEFGPFDVQVDGSGSRESRAYFGQHGGRVDHEDASDDVARPFAISRADY